VGGLGGGLRFGGPLLGFGDAFVGLGLNPRASSTRRSISARTLSFASSTWRSASAWAASISRRARDSAASTFESASPAASEALARVRSRSACDVRRRFSKDFSARSRPLSAARSFDSAAA
jgi:hypothetical protein